MIFEELETGRKQILTGFHFQDLVDNEGNTDIITIDSIREGDFYFSDEPISWYASHLAPQQRLYMLTIFLKNPLVMLEVETYPEYYMSKERKKALKNGYDSIIYTIKPGHDGLRQGVLFKPVNSIITIRHLPIPGRY